MDLARKKSTRTYARLKLHGRREAAMVWCTLVRARHVVKCKQCSSFVIPRNNRVCYRLSPPTLSDFFPTSSDSLGFRSFLGTRTFLLHLRLYRESVHIIFHFISSSLCISIVESWKGIVTFLCNLEYCISRANLELRLWISITTRKDNDGPWMFAVEVDWKFYSQNATKRSLWGICDGLRWFT